MQKLFNNKQHVNIYRVLYVGVVTMLYLTFINTCRIIFGSVFNKHEKRLLGLITLEINFLFGPLFLCFMGTLIVKLYYR
jgi:ACR3 family arsenite efflux pump ArsB